MDEQISPDFVKHALSRYKELLDEAQTYDFKLDPLEYPPDAEQRNLEETTAAIQEFPRDWLLPSRETYLQKHRRVLCRAVAWYVSKLIRQLGEENMTIAADNRLKEIGWLDKSFTTKKRFVEIEPILEGQFRAEIEIGSKLAREFCAPHIPIDIGYLKWNAQALEDWKRRHKKPSTDTEAIE